MLPRPAGCNSDTDGLFEAFKEEAMKKTTEVNLDEVEDRLFNRTRSGPEFTSVEFEEICEKVFVGGAGREVSESEFADIVERVFS